MSSLADVKSAIDKLNDMFPRFGFKLNLSDPYDLHTSYSSSYPNSGQPGVYVLLREDAIVLRIGKASCGRTLGQRLGDYFRWEDKSIGKGTVRDATFREVRYVVTIPVPKDRAFEAPAIEEFLLGHSGIVAPLNIVGVGL